jgi:hypothetical protein
VIQTTRCAGSGGAARSVRRWATRDGAVSIAWIAASVVVAAAAACAPDAVFDGATTSTSGGGGTTSSGAGGHGGTGSTSTSAGGHASGGAGGHASGGAGGHASGGAGGAAPAQMDWASGFVPMGGYTLIEGVAVAPNLIGVVGTTSAEVHVAQQNGSISVQPNAPGVGTAFVALLEPTGLGKYAFAARVASNAPSAGLAIAPFVSGFLVLHEADQGSMFGQGQLPAGGAAQVVTRLSSNGTPSLFATATNAGLMTLATTGASGQNVDADLAGTYPLSGATLTWPDATTTELQGGDHGLFVVTKRSGSLPTSAAIQATSAVAVHDVAIDGALHAVVGSFSGQLGNPDGPTLSAGGAQGAGYAGVANEAGGGPALLPVPPNGGVAAAGRAVALHPSWTVPNVCNEARGYVAGDGFLAFLCLENQVPVVKASANPVGAVIKAIAVDPDSHDVAIAGELAPNQSKSVMVGGQTIVHGDNAAGSCAFVAVLDPTLTHARLATVINPSGPTDDEHVTGVAILPNKDPAQRRVLVSGNSKGSFGPLPATKAGSQAGWVLAFRAW